MPKNQSSDKPAADPSGETTNSVSPEPAPAPKKRAKAAKSSGGKSAAKKQSAKTGAKKSASRSSAKKAKSHEPSDADIRLRAYFIAERRVQLALQGDPAEDWLEARQQLLEEAARKS